MPKTKIVLTNEYMRLSKAKSFCTEPQKGVLSLYFNFFSSPNAKTSKINKNISQSKFTFINL